MSAPIVSARAVRGELRLRAERDATGKTVLADRHAAGAFHLSKPYWDGRTLMVQWINPTAGIFAGDVLESDVRVGECASLLLTTPSATRIHTRIHAATPPGEQRLHFHVANGGFLEVQSEWLIPQKQSAFVQRTKIHVEDGGSLFFVEMIAPGRVAKGEVLEFDLIDLSFVLSINNIRIVQDRLHIRPSRDKWKASDAANHAFYLATVLVASQALTGDFNLAGDHLDLGCQVGVSKIRADVMAVRILSESPMYVRRCVARLRAELSGGCQSLRAPLRKL